MEDRYINFTIKLDDVFSKWLTDPFMRPVFNAIQEAADNLEQGKPANFDFDVFDATVRNANPQRYKPPTSSVQSSVRIQIDDVVVKKESILETIPHDTAKIPTFYGTQTYDNQKELADVDAAVAKGVKEENLGNLLSTYCRLPRCFAPVLLKTRDFSGDGLKTFWRQYLYGRDSNERFFKIIVANDRDFIFPSDLTPFVRAIVETHSSLLFLKDEALFQEKFIDFIVTRCFYHMDSELRGTAGLQQFRKMDLAAIFYNAERMPDVNDSHHIFNYQHFYVAFCKFWDLDADSDGFITKDDLLKFNDSGISPIIIERFFKSSFYPRSSNRKQTLDFTSFTYFLMSSEDKTNATSINFWYKLCDLDEDGIMSLKEIEELYLDQFERMRITGNETIPFEDILRQLMDMIDPEDPAVVTIADLTRSKMADVFFNSLFDLQKFLIREYQFPLVNPNFDEVTKHLTPWEIYVLIEYDQLVNDAG